MTSEAVPFVYLPSVCQSLQCLISTLTQACQGSFLFRFACSVLLQKGRAAADRYLCPVWGALTMFRPHWVCPHSRVCIFHVYTAQSPGCSTGSGPWVACGSSFQVFHKSVDSDGPAFCAFPARAAQGIRSLTGALSPGAVHLIPSVAPASVSARAGWVRLVSVLGSWSLAITLPADVNHPESQEVFG